MSLHYKFDILSALKAKGFSAYKLRQEKILSEGTIQSIRTNSPISWANIERLCALLDCQPGDILAYKK